MPRDDEAVAHAKKCAAWYRRRGWNPLPSRADKKAPAMQSYVKERDEGLPQEILDKWYSPNIQLATGIRWDLLAIDLDGPEAARVWRVWAAQRGCRVTWEVRGLNADGSVRGTHLWFRAPIGATEAPTTVLWGVWLAGEKRWDKRSKIELIGDRGLIVAPPSRHVKTGMPYEFVHGPVDMPQGPAPLPEWVLGLAGVRRHMARVNSPALPARPSRPFSQGMPHAVYDRNEVLGAIEDKVGLAATWAPWLVASRHVNESGWVSCRRDPGDRNPSASLHNPTGTYWTRNPDESISLFDLAVRLGAYPTAVDAINDLGARYGVRPRSRTEDKR